MIKRGLTLIVCFFLIGIIFESCGCRDVEDYFRRQNMNWQHRNLYFGENQEYNNLETNWNNNPTSVEDSLIYHINLTFEVEYYSYNSKGFDIFNKACARSCLYDGHEGSQEEVIDFIITSNNDFNDEYLAGENLNGLFLTNDNTLATAENLNRLSFTQSGFILHLSEKPTLDSIHQFTFVVIEEKNRYFEVITPEVTFL